MIKKVLSTDFNRCQGNTRGCESNSSDFASTLILEPSLSIIQVQILLFFLLTLFG
jgi:hypothetical protein